MRWLDVKGAGLQRPPTSVEQRQLWARGDLIFLPSTGLEWRATIFAQRFNFIPGYRLELNLKTEDGAVGRDVPFKAAVVINVSLTQCLVSEYEIGIVLTQ